jgi:hypothetical protein
MNTDLDHRLPWNHSLLVLALLDGVHTGIFSGQQCLRSLLRTRSSQPDAGAETGARSRRPRSRHHFFQASR